MKITVTVEKDDGSSTTSVYPVVEELGISGVPVYRDNQWPPEMVSCWFTLTFHARKDEEGNNAYVTMKDPT